MDKNGQNGQNEEMDFGNCDEVISESIGSCDTMVSVSKSSYLPLYSIGGLVLGHRHNFCLQEEDGRHR